MHHAPPSVDAHDLLLSPIYGRQGSTCRVVEIDRGEGAFVSAASGNLDSTTERGIVPALGIVLALCLASCASTDTARQSGTGLSPAVLAPIHDEALGLVRKYQTSPLRAARMLAYLDSAVLEASQSLAGTNAKTVGCNHVAYALASYSVLAHFFPLETPGRLLSMPRLMPEWNNLDCDEAKMRADTAAEAIIARAMRDGANPPKKVRVHPGRAIGRWEPTPP